MQFSPIQREVFDALCENSDRLAKMYFGAVAVLQQTNNPDRLALAAHGLRELMEKSPEYLDLKVAQTTGASLGVKVNELKVSWHGTFKKSKCRDHGKWTGQIDGHLRKFLKRAEAFFEFHEQKFPKLVERARQIVRRFDPLKGNLPEPLSNFRASSWQAMDDYFKKVAHHHSVESEQQFLSWMGALELFLLDGLRPRTAMDHADLKKIIEEAEQNA
jgi:hypothetical protein